MEVLSGMNRPGIISHWTLVLLFQCVVLFATAQQDTTTMEPQTYADGSFRTLIIEVVDPNMEPYKYTFTYHFPPVEDACQKLEQEHAGVQRIINYRYEHKHGKEQQFFPCKDWPSTAGDAKILGLKAEGKWLLGKKQGRWKYYNNKGELARVLLFRKGKLVE